MLDDRVDLPAHEQDEPGDEEPGQKCDDAADRAVGDVVTAEVGHIRAKTPTHQEPNQRPNNRARRDELDLLLDVGQHVVAEPGAERDHDCDDRPTDPADDDHVFVGDVEIAGRPPPDAAARHEQSDSSQHEQAGSDGHTERKQRGLPERAGLLDVVGEVQSLA